MDNLRWQMTTEWEEYDRLNDESLKNCGFAVGDKVKLNSSCPKDIRDDCRVRIGDVGTLRRVSAWPVNDTNGERVVLQVEVRWDHEEQDNIFPLGIFIEHLDKVATELRLLPTTNRRGAIAAQKAKKKNV